MSVHPLFDPRSRYRQATEISIWADSGDSSVQRFFHDRAREKLQEEWQFGIPAAAQDLGYSDETNRAIYESRTTLAAQGIESRVEELAESASPALPSPTLLVFDFGSPEMIPEPEQFKSPQKGKETFTGFARNQPQEASHFEVDLWLEQYRHTVMMLMSPRRLKHLADVWSRPEPANEGDVVSLIQHALTPTTLTDTKREPGKPSNASRLFDILRLVPTLEGISNSEGRLHIRVELGRECPTLERDSWVVACQGPCVSN